MLRSAYFLTANRHRNGQSENQIFDRLDLYQFRAPTFRFFSGERVGSQKNEFIRS